MNVQIVLAQMLKTDGQCTSDRQTPEVMRKFCAFPQAMLNECWTATVATETTKEEKEEMNIS